MRDCILDASLMAMVLSAADGVFTRPSLGSFLTLACGWVLCRLRRTTTGLIVAADAAGMKHFSSYHRLFSQAAWSAPRFWVGILRVAVRRLCPAGPLVLVGDDTVQAKYGRKISGASNWRNGCGSTRQQYRFLWGLDLVILALAVDFCGKTFCLPINLRLYRKEADCRRSAGPYRTRTELMRQMVQEVLHALPQRRVVLLVDGQFATGTLLGVLPQRLTVITRLRRDAAIYRPPALRAAPGRGRPALKGARLPTRQRLARDGRRPWQTTPQQQEVKTFEVLWYGVTKAQRIRLVIARQDNPREPYGYFLCTDPSWEPHAILSTYARRWAIEITIRDAKQHGGLADAQCRLSQAVERQHAFSLGMMTLVMAWYMDVGHQSERLGLWPWYRHKRGPTFLDMLAHARRRSLLARISINSPANPDIDENTHALTRYLRTAA
jgi:hypothetical protein